MKKLSTPEILDGGLDDWRKLAQALHTRYRISDFTEGAAFVAAIAEVADAADHHSDLKMTCGAVDVSLCTHEDGLWVTQKDIDLARKITEIARANGLTPEPAGVTQLEIALDTAHVNRVAPFWSVLLTGSRDNTVYDSVFDPTSRVPGLWFRTPTSTRCPASGGTSICGLPPRLRRGESRRPWRSAGPSSTTRRHRLSPCSRTRTATRCASARALSEADGTRRHTANSPRRHG